jgi:hypothetical protein
MITQVHSMWTSIANLKYMLITVIVDCMPHQTKNIDKVVCVTDSI